MKFSNQIGSAIIQVLVASALVGSLGAYLMKSTKNQKTLQKENRIDEIIESTFYDIRTSLASSEVCLEASLMNFQKIGTFTVAQIIDANTNLTLKAITPKARTGREQVIEFYFEYLNSLTQTNKTVRKTVPIIYFLPKENSAQEACVSYESSSIDDTNKNNCALVGGVWDNASGKCSFSEIKEGSFSDEISLYSCEVLGGVFVNGKCSKVTINGSIETGHIKNDKIIVNTTTRSGLQDFACGPTFLATGFNEDGSLDCKKLECPNLATSSYIAIEVAGQLKCQCLRDKTVEAPTYGCGDSDPSSCTDYLVNDGCGLGNKCTIKRGNYPACPRVAACGESVSNSCGEVCSVGAACTNNPCTDSSWTPAVTTICDGLTFSQTSNCGATRTGIGTKTCTAPGGGGSACVGGRTCNKRYEKCCGGRRICSDYPVHEC